MRHRYGFERVFDVNVGKPPFFITRFVLHSEVFENRTCLSVERSEDNTTAFIHEDPALFLTYLNTVYFGKDALEQCADVPVPDCSTEVPVEERQDIADMQFQKLIRLYLLADSLEDRQTADMIIDEIVRFSDAADLVPTQTPVTMVYTFTKPFGALRQLMVDLWTYARHVKHVERIRTGAFPEEFVQEITIDLFYAVRTEDRAELDVTVKDRCSEHPCQYHTHKVSSRCCSKYLQCKWIYRLAHDLCVL